MIAGGMENLRNPNGHPNCRVGGIVLAGGLSTRMGQSKSDLYFDAETLLQRVVRITSEAVSPVVVAAAASGQPLPRLPNAVRVVTDTIPNAGPLVGLLAGLRALEPTCEAAFVVACDQPLITEPFIRALIDALEGHTAVIVEHQGLLHPLTGVYRTSLLPALTDYLDQGKRTAYEFAKNIHAHIIGEQAFDNPQQLTQALRNINTPEDYTALQRHCRNFSP